ncbi:hypothetical protein [Dyadobacter pollutisoli]|uniref:Uncharacterized protein n=1 Tax=Dyadobacter pollutisoli TaxID=2910158 RepID=A0A9E8NDR3_9BACT|nr:hypothetical protein [Dyadobacter pollutisoli]WAC13117.1 hypothetical protein ON006_03965 [Dyadobacter pollutisoli]
MQPQYSYARWDALSAYLYDGNLLIARIQQALDELSEKKRQERSPFLKQANHHTHELNIIIKALDQFPEGASLEAIKEVSGCVPSDRYLF